jgi:hypothetical protein
MTQVHEKSVEIIDNHKISSMLMNEYNNKVNQYDDMYKSLETMKALASKEETIDNLINQQIEALSVRIKWELDWLKRVASSINTK